LGVTLGLLLGLLLGSLSQPFALVGRLPLLPLLPCPRLPLPAGLVLLPLPRLPLLALAVLLGLLRLRLGRTLGLPGRLPLHALLAGVGVPLPLGFLLLGGLLGCLGLGRLLNLVAGDERADDEVRPQCTQQGQHEKAPAGESHAAIEVVGEGGLGGPIWLRWG